jgi:hypothetical protein
MESQMAAIGIAKAVHGDAMISEDVTMLTSEEFASLLTIGNARLNSPAPAIPAEHSVRLIALGYVADLSGRLRMTTRGRMRIYAGQLAG